jgi:hypothetical protein
MARLLPLLPTSPRQNLAIENERDFDLYVAAEAEKVKSRCRQCQAMTIIDSLWFPDRANIA